eukprot:TRINITY_DN5061_c0_g1_i1.p2 TRINITY_DN5061_c0_g1~~TRINITY_DN5061_c0_g1_i1.p2  ORF type:complete len:149 (-),score=53.21 TRINITY_DN5061_c0_g1_i1:66-512(-)
MGSSSDNVKYEYRDHTADIMLHAWGDTTSEAFEQTALAMFNYMVELDSVKDETKTEHTIEVEGHDMNSLLFAFLDEWLFVFSTEFLVCKRFHILEFDRENWKIKCKGTGETFDKKKHASGTEIKAITYSCMEVKEEQGKTEIYTIVDI